MNPQSPETPETSDQEAGTHDVGAPRTPMTDQEMAARFDVPEDHLSTRGPLAWMAQNHVASNLLMLMLMLGGLIMLSQIKQEVFPEITLETVNITVAYPGASPAEVEQGTVLAIEDAIRGIDSIKEVNSAANEGSAVVTAELLLGADRDQALSDIKSAIDRVSSFPAEIERPTVSLVQRRREVISLVLYGDLSEHVLKDQAERVRDDLLTRKDITVVEIAGIRAPEISVEISQESMRRYNMTHAQIAQAIRSASIERPGGLLRTRNGEILLRTSQRRFTAEQFRDIVVLSRPDGTKLTVGDLGDVKDTFAEGDDALYFNGKRAVQVAVYRVGDQTPVQVANVVKEYVEEWEKKTSGDIKMAMWRDQSEVYRDRVSLLLRNALQGLVLVLIVLGLFLELRLAFWVTLGIPISFLGALLFMPGLDVSINMISLFAFILTLGIVVDDAIVVGESIHKRRQDGMPPIPAALAGVREVAAPVVFSVLTTVMAFAPLLFIPGVMGKFFKSIPLIVIPILLISLVESLLILPAHLSGERKRGGVLGFIGRAQQRFADSFEALVAWGYPPLASAAVKQRYLTMALATAVMLWTGGLVASGKLRVMFFPKIGGDAVTVNIELPYGASSKNTEEAMHHVIKRAQKVFKENGGEAALSRGILSRVGSMGGRSSNPGVPRTGSHAANVSVYLTRSEQRDLTTEEFVKKWRQAIGTLPGVKQITFDFNIGPGSGTDVDVELSHTDMNALALASKALAEKVKAYGGVVTVSDGFAPGKEQLDFKLKPAGRSLNLTESDLANQVRNAFYGAEAVRQQRGRDEVRVFVRRPERERQSEYYVEQLLLRTPGGGEIPLGEAAEVIRGRAYTKINRRNGRRIVHVTANVDRAQADPQDILRDLKQNALPKLAQDHPGITSAFGGDQRDMGEVMSALARGLAMAMLAMFGLLAVASRSYIQPVVILGAVPFGIVGAALGHYLLGYSLSMPSMLGIVALSGVVVNDSLLLVTTINNLRGKHERLVDAVIDGGVRRARPIWLTTLTTFFGLVPMIMEKSVQAKFLIPMAISLGCGVLFVTVIVLIVVPALYGIVEDVRSLVGTNDHHTQPPITPPSP